MISAAGCAVQNGKSGRAGDAKGPVLFNLEETRPRGLVSDAPAVPDDGCSARKGQQCRCGTLGKARKASKAGAGCFWWLLDRVIPGAGVDCGVEFSS